MLIHQVTGEFLEEGSQDPFSVSLELDKKSYYMGLDMGKEGAVTLVPVDRNLPVFVFKMPLTKSNEVDRGCLKAYINSWSPYVIHGVTERLHAIFQSSSKSMFNFGKVVGTTLTVLELAGVPYTELKPSIWQKEMFLGEPETMDTKTRSIMVARKMFPNLTLSKFTTRKVKLKEDNNITDALLMAEYARRKNL